MLLIVALDQATKWAILTQLHLPERPAIEVTGFFDLAMVWNTGISFGLLAGQKQPWLLLFVSLTIMIILLRWLIKTHSTLVALGLGMALGGALGNVIDRLRYGAVADFLDFHLGTLHWPAFNFADSAIFIGVVVLCWDSMFTQQKSKDTNP